ncbi:P-loop containing nucleoside triphosphate hydrolase protein [Syncephalis plumigaleata]|nr:P-loop containing nucleoside triphosphate hydrolase protein [Syncephalis plumigaleata]
MTAHSVCSNGSSAAGDSGSVSVKVAVRTRPLSAMEAAQRNGGFEILSLDQHRRVVTVVPEARNFSYDYVFSPESTQTETSSGKTHTMGTGCAHDYNNDAVGIIPRAINELFERIYHAQQPRSAGGGGGGTRYQVRVSFLEIYNEELIDLLSETGARAQVQIREDPRGNIYWTGVREVLVNSVDEVME